MQLLLAGVMHFSTGLAKKTLQQINRNDEQ